MSRTRLQPENHEDNLLALTLSGTHIKPTNHAAYDSNIALPPAVLEAKSSSPQRSLFVAPQTNQQDNTPPSILSFLRHPK